MDIDAAEAVSTRNIEVDAALRSGEKRRLWMLTARAKARANYFFPIYSPHPQRVCFYWHMPRDSIDKEYSTTSAAAISSCLNHAG